MSEEISLQAQGIEFTNLNFNSFITNLLSSKINLKFPQLLVLVYIMAIHFFENVSGKANIKMAYVQLVYNLELIRRQGLLLLI
ncbi:hypothetical protein GOM44_04045 [Wolbachia endosymbiont of Atemnus politus]|uniref:hypothetical protein n=1 Tax=Wolbachia endosymbiont of Atemnus politus TaxID=2682840 RepID=UPI00157489C7|nr:hypothetical protein [Wolbachia endosymbiont of Atemnus politus]